MKGTWLLPTHGRIPSLTRFMLAAIKAGTSTSGLVLVQQEEYADHIAEYEAITMPHGWAYHLTESKGMGDKFREIWDDIKDLDWVGWTVDDQTPITHEWDRLLISGLNGRNIISCNDEHRAPYRICTPVFSGDLLRAVGYLYAPGFWHAWMDDAWEQLGVATGCWQVCMDVVVKHDDGFKTGVMDETHKASYSRMAEDQAAYEIWKRTDMDRAVLAILNIPITKDKEVAYG